MGQAAGGIIGSSMCGQDSRKPVRSVR